MDENTATPKSISFKGHFKEILLFPYSFFTHPFIQFVFVSVGIFGGGANYIFISLAIFVLHSLSKKLREYETNEPSNSKGIPKIPLIQRVALSFVLGFFILIYMKGNNPDNFVITLFGQLSLPLILIFVFSGMFSVFNLKKYEEQVLPGLVVICFGVLYVLLQNHTFVSETYGFFIQYLFGVPSLYIVKALFLGLNWNEAHACFWKGSYDKEATSAPKKIQ